VPGQTDTKSQAFPKHYQSALDITAGMWAPRPAYPGLSENETERQKIHLDMIAQSLSAEVVQNIWHCLNTMSVLGAKVFRDQVNALRS
jgi:hypothetical protein